MHDLPEGDSGSSYSIGSISCIIEIGKFLALSVKLTLDVLLIFPVPMRLIVDELEKLFNFLSFIVLLFLKIPLTGDLCGENSSTGRTVEVSLPFT